MNAFDCYSIFTALKLHFNTDTYDFFKYNGKTRCKIESMLRSGQQFLFEKIARKYKTQEDITNFFLANILVNSKIWAGDLSDENYRNWLARMEGFDYHFSTQLSKIALFMEMNGIDFNSLFKVIDGSHPPILKMFRKGEISIETFLVLERILHFFNNFDKQLNNDPVVWPQLRDKCLKYSGFFLLPDLDKYKKIAREKLIS